MEFKNAADIKYYLYFSRTKLDMLFQQVADSGQETTTIEWSFGVKPLTAKRTTQKVKTPDDDDKLKAVLTVLERSERIGTLEEPKEYVRGLLPMRWGIYGDSGRPAEEPPLVYFAAKTEDTILGLGGSARHVMGVFGSSSTSSRSATPCLVAHLVEGLGLPLDGWNAYCLSDHSYSEVFEAMNLATERLRGVEQQVEFVAKVLLAETCLVPPEPRICRFILATPLFVALAHPYPDNLSDY